MSEQDFHLPDDLAALEGTTRPVVLRGVTFQAKPTMHARDFGAFSTIASGEVQGNLFELVNGVIRNTLVPSERERWDDLLAMDMAVPIDWAELVALADTIAGRAVDRPTVPPSPSGSTNGSTSTRSMDGSGSTEAQVSLTSSSGPA